MKNLKWLLLGIFLILFGLATLGVGFPFLDVIMGICALVAGILFLINR